MLTQLTRLFQISWIWVLMHSYWLLYDKVVWNSYATFVCTLQPPDKEFLSSVQINETYYSIVKTYYWKCIYYCFSFVLFNVVGKNTLQQAFITLCQRCSFILKPTELNIYSSAFNLVCNTLVFFKKRFSRHLQDKPWLYDCIWLYFICTLLLCAPLIWACGTIVVQWTAYISSA